VQVKRRLNSEDFKSHDTLQLKFDSKEKKEEDIRRKKTTKTIIHKKQISSINKGSQKKHHI